MFQRLLPAYLLASCLVVVGCSAATDRPAAKSQPGSQKVASGTPAERAFPDAKPLPGVAPNSPGDAVRRTSYALAQGDGELPPPELPVPKVDGDAYRILAQAAKAYQVKLAVVAHNLANAETVAFKRSRVILENLPYRHSAVPGTLDSAGQYAPVGIAIGAGVRVAGVQTDFGQGAFHTTDSQLDLAIQGPGFFPVTDPTTGEILYTRAGNFSKNANGELVTGSSSTGRLLEPSITVPGDATAIVISSEGLVSVRQPGSTALSQVGQIELATFVNPEGLLKRGENLYAETDASGAATLGNPGQDGLGTLRQGTLEASNAEPEQEQIDWERTARSLQRVRRLLQVE